MRRRLHGLAVLDGVTLAVPRGARLLLVSRPEESGSLLLRIMAGLARADAGSVRLAEPTDPGANEWSHRVAYVGQQTAIPGWMSGRQALILAARLRGLSRDEAELRAGWLESAFRLTGSMDRPLDSTGPPIAQRVALAAALVEDPQVLLLDDPLRAVDPQERSRLLRIPGERRTMIIASRYPASEAGLCSHVAVLERGRVALVTPLRRLAAEGLPLSRRGLDALAARLAPARPEPEPQAVLAP